MNFGKLIGDCLIEVWLWSYPFVCLNSSSQNVKCQKRAFPYTKRAWKRRLFIVSLCDSILLVQRPRALELPRQKCGNLWGIFAKDFFSVVIPIARDVAQLAKRWAFFLYIQAGFFTDLPRFPVKLEPVVSSPSADEISWQLALIDIPGCRLE